MRSSFARVIGVCFAAFIAMPLVASSCASSDEGDAGPFSGGSSSDAKFDGKGGTTSGGGTGSGGTKPSGGGGMPGGGGAGGGTGGGGSGGTASGGGGSGGGGTCNPQTCPTPAAPAVKCCVTANGPCGVDYKQGAGCQVPSIGDI